MSDFEREEWQKDGSIDGKLQAVAIEIAFKRCRNMLSKYIDASFKMLLSDNRGTAQILPRSVEGSTDSTTRRDPKGKKGNEHERMSTHHLVPDRQTKTVQPPRV